MLTILITVLVYSLINTGLCLYKDASTFFECDVLDVIMGGPILWIIMGVFRLIKPIVMKIRSKQKKTKKKKLYSPKQIENTVAKVVKRMKYKKEYYDLSSSIDNENCYYLGWGSLVSHSAKNEHLLRRFTAIMYSEQNAAAIECLKKYFAPVTREDLKAEGYDDYDCNFLSQRILYKLKS